MNGYAELVKKKLKEAGWRYHRQGKGSHEIWIKDDEAQFQTVPYACKSRALANKILKQAGIDHRF